MPQKAIIGLLVITIIGAVVMSIYDTNKTNITEETPTTVGDYTENTPETTVVVDTNPAEIPTQNNPDVTAEVVVDSATASAETTPQQQAANNMGELWYAKGEITNLTEVGMALKLDDGSEPFVELGPSSFWQTGEQALVVGDQVFVEGLNNDGQIHARFVKADSGFQLIFRNETGQPMWSGGASGSNGGAGAGTIQNQVAPEEWVILNGIIVASTNGSIVIQTPIGEQTQLQLGQSRFWKEQGISLDIGLEVNALGYWQGDQFQAGEITIILTGQRLMLRDPNGRPLWAGSGGNGGNHGG